MDSVESVYSEFREVIHRDSAHLAQYVEIVLNDEYFFIFCYNFRANLAP